MKKIVFYLVMFATCLSLHAQSEPGHFSITPQIGVSQGKFSGDFYIDNHQVKQKFRAGFTGGIEVAYQHDANWAFSLGAFYTQGGTKWNDVSIYPTNPKDGDEAEEWTDIHWTVDNITIPLMAHYYITDGLAVKAGVEIAVPLSCKQKLGAQLLNYDADAQRFAYSSFTETENDYKEALKKPVFYIPLGISYEYEQVQLDLRYHIPLTKTFKHDIVNDKTKNQLVTVTVGYRFEL